MKIAGPLCKLTGARAAAALLATLVAFPIAPRAWADAWLPAGDTALRHDVQMLVDGEVIDVPITAWPVPRADLARAIDSIDRTELSASQLSALTRLESALASDNVFGARLSGAAKPMLLRTFADTPREEGEVEFALAADHGRFSGRLELTAVTDPDDDQIARLDGSHATVQLGNWLLSANALDRWWGPGWDGSLILSSNARPVPALSFDRASSTPFETKWLSWIGPWRLTAFLGRMEDEREDIDHPLLFGMRVAFRPLDGLEIGFERTAQFCGEGLPCDLNAFWDVFAGDDNAGEDVDPEDEPGNQLAGWTLRWSSPIGSAPYAIYWQHTGETIDHDLPRPLRSMELIGVETWGDLEGGASWRVNLEFSGTACGEIDVAPAPYFDCAYNNGIFNVEGYRYRGRTIGHAIDGDSRLYSLGAHVTTASAHHWSVLGRFGEINRGGAVPDTRHTIAAEPTDLWNLEAALEVPRGGATWRIGLGFDQFKPESTGRTERAVRAFAEWRQRF